MSQQSQLPWEILEKFKQINFWLITLANKAKLYFIWLMTQGRIKYSNNDLMEK